MQTPLQITFRGMAPSEALEADIRERAGKLERLYSRISGMKVVIEQVERRHLQGNHFQVHVDLVVPGRELVASRDATTDGRHEDAFVAVGDAFSAVRRRLQDHARRQRGEEKHHEGFAHGKVLSLSPKDGRGVIEDSQGREVQFTRNSVVDGAFHRLEVGDEVRFSEAEGTEFPTASTVHVVGKHHYVD